MNLSTFPSQKPSSQKHKKHRKQKLTEDQVRLLESNFDSTKKLEPERKHQLSRQLGIPPRQIAIWYQNKRARWKNQSLEHDYTMLQLQLEAALVDTKQLQKEVEQLRSELNKLQAEQARRYKQYNNNINNHHRSFMDYSVSVCHDEAWSSSRSLEEDVNNLYRFDAQVFDVEETYAASSMMGSDIGVFGWRKNLL
ncbi:hypothetical protein QVD17_30075 [Tagetes erecta]|uniref:Homeobox-leucine zipper protein n=1 Tax=Tagetes erecta TaxID=13708 RepID=A0AAD8NMY3_TARER|nr:hypothetical protein QVD17_30075 [Tagetes erecta]